MRLGAQAASLALAAALGMLLGLGYDAVRPLRRSAPAGLQTALDACYCLISGALVFCLAMAADNGRLGVWEPVCSMLGFAVYARIAGDRAVGIFTAIYRAVRRFFRAAKKIIKKTAVSAKMGFQKMRKCFIIKK